MDNNENHNYNHNQNMKLPIWVAIILVLSLVLNLVMYSNVKSIKQELANLQNNINNINNSVNSSIGNNMNQINEMLKKEASLVTEFTYEMGEYKDKRVDFLLNLKLKAFKKEDKVFFACKTKAGNLQLIEAKSTDDVNFAAKLNMSIFDNMDIDVLIENDAGKRTEKLESIYRPVDKIAAQIQPRSIGGSVSYERKKGAIIATYEFELLNHQGKGDVKEYTLSDVRLEVRVNDKVIETKVMPISVQIPNNRYYIHLKDYEIPCRTGDSVKINILANDDKGFNYKCLVEEWKVNEDGSLNAAAYPMDLNRVEIY